MKYALRWQFGLLSVALGLCGASAQVVVPSTTEITQVAVCWDSSLGLRYQVQFQSGPGAEWVNLGASIAATTTRTCLDDSYVDGRTYRVVELEVPPPPTTGPADMAWIPAGSFTMGSPASELCRGVNEGPQTFVTLSEGFWMDKYEVTQSQYLSVVGVNPSNNQRDLANPVENVTWHDATNYCRLLNIREQAAGRLPEGYAYRLPTEAEWEYACRAGTTTPFYFGNEMRSGMANFDGRWEYPPCPPETNGCPNPNGIYIGRSVPVGSYQPNAFGLYDMHGNVWEWVQDWYSRNHPGGNVTDPKGPATHTQKVLKGGRYYFYSHILRSAYRTGHLPGFGRVDLGFRAVLARVP